jgi:predicted membrane protein
METNNRFLDRRAVLGIVLMLLGTLFLAENLNWLNFSIFDMIFSLPMLLILVGVISLNHKGSNPLSFILIGIGLFLLLPHVFHLPFETHRVFWPLILVALGVLILFRKKKTYNFCQGERERSSSDHLDEINIFGGCERKVTSKSFHGGKITSIFGGSSIDLLECELSEGRNVIDVVHIFGGTKMIVPSDWRIQIEIVSIFGGFADKRRSFGTLSSSPEKTLYITGVVIFGGGEIKNF